MMGFDFYAHCTDLNSDGGAVLTREILDLFFEKLMKEGTGGPKGLVRRG